MPEGLRTPAKAELAGSRQISNSIKTQTQSGCPSTPSPTTGKVWGQLELSASPRTGFSCGPRSAGLLNDVKSSTARHRALAHQQLRRSNYAGVPQCNAG